jgi:hypothetical protein
MQGYVSARTQKEEKKLIPILYGTEHPVPYARKLPLFCYK